MPTSSDAADTNAPGIPDTSTIPPPPGSENEPKGQDPTKREAPDPVSAGESSSGRTEADKLTADRSLSGEPPAHRSSAEETSEDSVKASGPAPRSRAAERKTRPSRAAKQRTGPSWLGIFAAMIVTSMLTILGVFAVWGMQSPFASSGSPFYGSEEDSVVEDLQSGAELVSPVEASTEAPDWVAVAEAVRPATVSLMAEGASSAASGSGVIIDGEGHLVTNYHVVSGATNGGTVTATTNDGSLFKADIVGVDPTTDLAVLRLQAAPANLVAARLGSSEDLQVGQPVMAIGAPLGLADTTTTGIISALDRPVAAEAGDDGTGAGEQEVVVTNAIQIDASINPGNSGGPLFDEHGYVIGINSSIAAVASSASEAGSIGLGFAIPVDLVASVTEQIIHTGEVQHALLGVQIRTVSLETAGTARLGAEVAVVVPGGAAEASGLQVGDVIIGIDGHAVTSGPALTGYVRRYQPGDEVTLTLMRDGVDQTVDVVLKER